MIIAALGLAAAENLLFLYLLEPDPLRFATMRFIGATILHALCSALVGYYIALSFFNLKNKLKLILKGLLMAILLHGLFNFSIIKISESIAEINGQLIITDQQSFITFSFALIALLIGLAIFVIYGFKKVKKLKSVCKI
jgi:RsiW-degrading membrane proteinase PrsW (M82 family)